LSVGFVSAVAAAAAKARPVHSRKSSTTNSDGKISSHPVRNPL
jgi:hypothetical protein